MLNSNNIPQLYFFSKNFEKISLKYKIKSIKQFIRSSNDKYDAFCNK